MGCGYSKVADALTISLNEYAKIDFDKTLSINFLHHAIFSESWKVLQDKIDNELNKVQSLNVTLKNNSIYNDKIFPLLSQIQIDSQGLSNSQKSKLYDNYKNKINKTTQSMYKKRLKNHIHVQQKKDNQPVEETKETNETATVTLLKIKNKI